MEVINKELNMWSCTADELTYRQIDILRNCLGEDSKLFEFESFFDNATGRIIINKNKNDYNRVVRNYTCHLSANENERIAIKNRFLKKNDKYALNLCKYLDDITWFKENFEMCELMKYQKVSNIQAGLNMFESISAHFKNDFNATGQASPRYVWRVIQDKKIERAKRKRH